MPALAIVGAGAAGLAAARALRDAALAVSVFEKSRGVGGRAATRRYTTAHGTWHVDHGASYVAPPPGHPAERLVEALADARIERPVWTFAPGAAAQPGDPARNAQPRWTGREGVNALARRLAEGAPVVRGLRVERLTREGERWTLHAEDGTAHGPFDAVLLTPPAPQSADLLAVSAFDADLRAVLVDGLRAAVYRKQLALLLGFDRPVAAPGGAYAFVDPSGAHPVAWLGFEDAKPGHVPEGCAALVAQMAPGWTRDHYALPTEQLVEVTRPLLEGVLGGALPAPVWTDRQRWRYALPDAPADAEALALGAPHGLFFAGDFVSGRGRVHEALAAGLDAAASIHAYLAEP